VLREALAKSSRNSSRPLSSDSPGAKARPKKSPSGRKPGGQPGHKRHERVLLPPEKVHEIVPCIPKQCAACAGMLHGQDPEPHRHQVASSGIKWHQVCELPPAYPVVTEYQQHALDCGLCGHRTMGKLPEGVSARAFGPPVDAVVAVLMGVYRLTKRQVPQAVTRQTRRRDRLSRWRGQVESLAVDGRHHACGRLHDPREQRRRTGRSPRRHHAEVKLRNAFRGGKPFRLPDADRPRHAPPATPQHSRLHACGLHRRASESPRPIGTPHRNTRKSTTPRRVGA
jgi:Family of unknown function (DUF6444)